MDEINKMEFIKSGLSNAGLKVALIRLLSKHLKDLPMKKEYGVNKDGSRHGWSSYNGGVNRYNQCLKDCDETS